MNVLILTQQGRLLHKLDLRSRQVLISVVVICALLLLVIFVFGLLSARWWQIQVPRWEIQEMHATIERERADAKEAKAQIEKQVNALALRIAELQTRAIRLDALGERLTKMAGLSEGEFNFSESPGVGGPGETEILATDYSVLTTSLDQLNARLATQSAQLNVLEQMLMHQRLYEQVHPSGRPVDGGYVSSGYGLRTDPFHGNRTMHAGIDFAGRAGVEIKAVADGLVTWSGDRFGYGNMVEIDHGNGYATRYAHNRNNTVHVGDRVQRGQVVAQMGSTGHSTGPHVHFEVLKNGRPVDPLRYIQTQP